MPSASSRNTVALATLRLPWGMYTDCVVRVSMFLRKDSVIGKILEMRETSQSDILSSLFSDAVIAMGLDIPRRNDDEGQAPSSHHSDYFALLLNASAGLYTSPSSLLKLQVRKTYVKAIRVPLAQSFMSMN